jgi:uncharacterized protein YbjT (DUF2867 family)
MIILTGVTGGLGWKVLKSLLTLVPPSTIRVSTRDLSKLPADVQTSGAELVRGDYSEPASLDAAFAGASAVLLVSYPSIAHAERVRMHTAAIDAAVRAGVAHVFYTSLAFDAAGGAAVMRAHRDTEAYLKASGLTHTIVREGIYSESSPLYLRACSLCDLLRPHAYLACRLLPAEQRPDGRVRPRRWRDCMGEPR